MLTTIGVEELASRFTQQPCALCNLTLELSLAPTGIADKRPHDRLLVMDAVLRFLHAEMVPALNALRLRVPLERGKNQLVRTDRTAQKNRDARKNTKILAWQNIGDGAAGQPIHCQAKAALLWIMRGKEEDRFAEIGVVQTGMGNEKRAGKTARRGPEFAHKRTLEMCGEFSTRKRLPNLLTVEMASAFVSVHRLMSTSTEPLRIAGRQFSSRLLLGTGKFSSNTVMAQALEASGTQLVTVALRRADLSRKGDAFANILDFVDPGKYLLLPNTSGAINADEAVRLARLARAAGISDWIKLEIHPDPRFLLPDPVETLKAAEILVKEGFTVLPYINADPVLAKRLEDVGTATVMPLGSPIGSNRGIETRAQIEIMLEQASVPVIVDAGLGAPSQAAEALEMGASAVLVNTAIAIANDPVRMAAAFRKAVEAGREAFESGLAERIRTTSPTSPLTGFLQSAKSA